jgi:hypothetical protein
MRDIHSLKDSKEKIAQSINLERKEKLLTKKGQKMNKNMHFVQQDQQPVEFI